jgi:hypothetical protein
LWDHAPETADATLSTGEWHVNMLVLLGSAVLILAALAIAAFGWAQYRRLRRRGQALHRMLDDADCLEADLKDCRRRLDRAHAVMAVVPGVPAAGESDARLAVDAGLRSLLEHRLWIRDRAPDASQQELDAAVAALAQARERLEPQLQALDHAQRELDQAVREHLDRESPP